MPYNHQTQTQWFLVLGRELETLLEKKNGWRHAASENCQLTKRKPRKKKVTVPPTLFDWQLISGKFSAETTRHLWLLYSKDEANKKKWKHTQKNRLRGLLLLYCYITSPLQKPLIKENPLAQATQCIKFWSTDQRSVFNGIMVSFPPLPQSLPLFYIWGPKDCCPWLIIADTPKPT